MENIPQEIILDITEYLDLKDVIALSGVNKSFNKACKNNTLWKNKCIKDYNKHGIPSQGYLEYYKFLYESLCVCCYRQAHSRDHFYNHLVCHSCKLIQPKYITYCKTELKKELYLKENEISLINHKKLTNTYMFLRSQVIEYIESNNLKETLIKRKNKSIQNKINKILRYSFRYSFLNEILTSYFNIDANDYQEITSYAPSEYKNYMKKYTDVKKSDCLQELLLCYIELEYLKRNHLYANNVTREGLETIMLYDMIIKNEEDITVDGQHIKKLKAQIYTKHFDKFQRKELVKKLFKENNREPDMQNIRVWSFIYYGSLQGVTQSS